MALVGGERDLGDRDEENDDNAQAHRCIIT